MVESINTKAQQLLREAKSILLIDWPNINLPYALLKAGFIVFSYSPDQYSKAKLLAEKPHSTDGMSIFPVSDEAYVSFEKLDDSPGAVDIVHIYRPESELPGIVEKHVLPLSAKAIWLHPPQTSELARGLAAQHCIELVQGVSIIDLASELKPENMENETGPTLGNGKICYVEIPADDIAKSAAFYSEIFGWKTRKRGDGHLAFDDGINEVSGTWVTGRKKHSEAGFIVSIMVDSVAETVKKITDSGCQIIKQMNLSDHEIIAWFNDPFGNLLGLYQHPGGGNGKICYVEIPANDILKSANFYEAVFGWPIRSDNHGNAAFDDGVGVVSGMWTNQYKPSTEPGLMVYVMIDSVEETVEAVIANGGKIVQPIGMDAPEITARFSDPFGNVFGLYQEPGG
ncbi:MAG TPA: VOC family protein [Mucilaginibacter sp.]|jgi:predicted enzyme related to lactoylglutathione lyase/predicted CoA-binding protein|nr:VOC family protein [Mucilaginibacter sp.]